MFVLQGKIYINQSMNKQKYILATLTIKYRLNKA